VFLDRFPILSEDDSGSTTFSFFANQLAVQEVLFVFQGAMLHFCRLLPGHIREQS
jgi:hypothetical protein